MRYLFITIILFSNVYSQVEFVEHTISDSAWRPFFIYAVDLDGDGDLDILSACSSSDNIEWYENDSLENFTPHIIYVT